MWATQTTSLEIVRINVFTKVNGFSDFLRFSPYRRCVFLGKSKWDRWSRELEIIEIESIKFTLSCSISLERFHDINCSVLDDVFFSKSEVLGYFLSFSEESWFIILVSVRKRMKDFNRYFFNLCSRLSNFNWLHHWFRSFLNRLFLRLRFVRIIFRIYIVIDLRGFYLRRADDTNSSDLITLFRFLVLSWN